MTEPAEGGTKRGRLRWLGDVAVFLALFVGFHWYQTRELTDGVLAARTLITLEGERVVVGGESDEPTLVHFWATWCGVCSAEEGNILALSKGARVLTIASRSGPPDQVRRHLRARGLTFQVINDPDGRLASAFGVRAFPSSFVLDRGGRVAFRDVGYTTTLGLRGRLWLAGL